MQAGIALLRYTAAACVAIVMASLVVLPLPVFASYTETMTTTDPRVASITSSERDETIVGEHLGIDLHVQNLLNEDKDYAVIIDVRDSAGITETLSWQTGTIDAQGAAYAGVTWIPQRAGDYQIRAFVLSSIDNPQPYSSVAQSEITIVEP